MSIIAPIEQQIVARLRAALTIDADPYPRVDVEPWPNDPASYKMRHPRGAVLAMYAGSKFDESATARQVISFDARFELVIISKTLRAPEVALAAGEPDTGVYTLLDVCRNALLGWRPDGAANIVRLVAESYEGYGEGTWRYSLTVELPMLAVVDRAEVPGEFDVPGAPPLADINFQEM